MKLTDRIQASGASLNDLIHIVITSDTSQNSAGSSYKIPMSEYVPLFNGYKVYTALLTQTGSTAPTAVVLENTLGITPSYSYDGTGQFHVDLSGMTGINSANTVVITGNYGNTNPIGADYIIVHAYQDFIVPTKINIETIDNGSAYYDGILLNSAIEIRVYN